MNNFNLFLYACHTVWYGISYGIKTFLRLLNVTNTTVCAWVLTELLPRPVYAWKQMSPLSILGGKKLSFQYCLKLSCNYNNPAYTAVLILNSTLYLKENLSYLLLQSVLQVICKRLVSKRVILLHFSFQPHCLLTRPVVNFTLHCADKINTPPKMFKYRSYEVTSSRITIAYLLMALKMVTELLLLWSIETILSVFDYLTQQASSEQNYTRFCL